MEIEQAEFLEEIYKLYPGYTKDISKDCDFNFGTRKEKLLKLAKGEENLVREIELCHKRYHQICNFSLIPATGALGVRKKGGRNGEDRLDVFLAELKKLFDIIENNDVDNILKELANDYECLNRNSRLKLLKGLGYNRENKKWLIQYLKYNFEGFEDYCKKMYLIEDEKYLAKFIEDISPLKTIDNVKEFIEKVKGYWDYKEKRLVELGVSREKIAELNDKIREYEDTLNKKKVIKL